MCAVEWKGRQLLDANGQPIGLITGPGYDRRRFGTSWLIVETDAGRRFLVPGDDIRESGERLMLPYPRGYVESGPVLDGDRPLDAAGERRLRMHYGIGGAGPNTGCRAGCGLCMGARRAEHRQKTG